MKRALLILIAIVALAPSAAAQETATLTAPETKVSKTLYRFDYITERFDNPATPADEGEIRIVFVGDDGEPNSCVYRSTTTPTATTLSNGQNKARFDTAYAGNATTGARKQRILHRLVVGPGTLGESAQVCDKPITGSLTGSVP